MVMAGRGPGAAGVHKPAGCRFPLGDKAKEWRRQCFPRARHVAELGAAAFRAGQAVPPEQALPVYVRDEVAVKKSPAQT